MAIVINGTNIKLQADGVSHQINIIYDQADGFAVSFFITDLFFDYRKVKKFQITINGIVIRTILDKQIREIITTARKEEAVKCILIVGDFDKLNLILDAIL